MKIMTINTHSLAEDNYEEKLLGFVRTVIKEKPEIIAMQEVNQTCSAAPFNADELSGMFPCKKGLTVRADNHVARVVKLLKQKGINYYWTWLPVKIGYGKYDEGLALMSLSPITETDTYLISSSDDYNNWKTRRVLGIKTDKTKEDWFYTVHMGWWNDEEEPFASQWKRLSSHFENQKRVWLMGDFNSRADVKNEGYDLIRSFGWTDTYMTAKKKDSGFTVEKAIDGWRDKDAEKMRIDYIMCNRETEVESSEVIFNGMNGPVISDHYGIVVTYKQE